MQKENNVNPTTKMVAITPAQEKLLEFVQNHNPKHLKKALRHVKDSLLYFSQNDLNDDDRTACFLVNSLEFYLGKIGRESLNFKNN